jgi:hypothetical protein
MAFNTRKLTAGFSARLTSNETCEWNKTSGASIPITELEGCLRLAENFIWHKMFLI